MEWAAIVRVRALELASQTDGKASSAAGESRGSAGVETPTSTPRPNLSTLRGRAAEWATAYLGLLRASYPTGWPPRVWAQLLDDMGDFLSTWATPAIEVGWSELDLFGVHHAVPRARFDVMGLVPLLDGKRVIAMEQSTAVIQGRGGRDLRFYRRLDDASLVEAVSVLSYPQEPPAL
jgi:hypothetical protein